MLHCAPSIPEYSTLTYTIEPFRHEIRRQPDLVRPGPRSLVGHLVDHANYFSDTNAGQLLDYDHDNDPIWRCIVTEEEANTLLDVFWKHLQPLVRNKDVQHQSGILSLMIASPPSFFYLMRACIRLHTFEAGPLSSSLR